MTVGVLPFFGLSHSPTSRVAPSRQLAKVGDASNVFNAVAKALRSVFGKNESTSNAPIFSMGGLFRS
jgi:hypothetical protein